MKRKSFGAGTKGITFDPAKKLLFVPSIILMKEGFFLRLRVDVELRV